MQEVLALFRVVLFRRDGTPAAGQGAPRQRVVPAEQAALGASADGGAAIEDKARRWRVQREGTVRRRARRSLVFLYRSWSAYTLGADYNASVTTG